MADVFQYFDYRSFLKEAFDFRKQKNPRFSYRVLARKAGFSSAGFFSKILNGTSNISHKTALALAEVFELKQQETDYFLLLIGYNQAKSHTEKRHYFERILAHRKSDLHELEKAQYEIFSEWFYVAVLELLDYTLFRDDYSALAAKLHPKITTAQAKKAVQILETCGLIHKNPDGYYQKTNAALSTGENWSSLAVANFQRTMLQMGQKALEITNRDDRDISTLTLSIGPEAMEKIQEKLKSTRREILAIARNDNHAAAVYQLNLQLFPLSLFPSDLYPGKGRRS